MAKVQFLTEKEVANVMRLSLRWLQHKRLAGGGPPFVRFGRAVRYPLTGLMEWCDAPEQRRGSNQ